MWKVLGITALVVLVAVSAIRAETLQPYRDAAGLFSIFYPKGWGREAQRGHGVHTRRRADLLLDPAHHQAGGPGSGGDP
ncbi:MAG: hypothetical protein QN139_03915, partial [Armatimonadota bacterium]|nr:hypothetical protein [Armatimonadota bacterium]